MERLKRMTANVHGVSARRGVPAWRLKIQLTEGWNAKIFNLDMTAYTLAARLRDLAFEIETDMEERRREHLLS